MTTMERYSCRQLGTLAGSFDYWIAETRKREAALPGLSGAPYRVAARAFQTALEHQQRAITDLRDGAAHAAVVAGWTPVLEDSGEGENGGGGDAPPDRGIASVSR